MAAARAPLPQLGLLAGLMLALAGCGPRPPVLTPADPGWEPTETLSGYRLFLGNGSTQDPAPGVVAYDINTPLFSDYATKYRFVRLPPGTQAGYQENEVLAFPVGTILVKTFAYLHDLADPSRGRQLIETRLLIHRPEGWIGLPYVWNDEQTEATLRKVGGTREVRWRHTDGRERTLEYLIPNVNQCLACHENNRVMKPLGPKAGQLNRELASGDVRENQLHHWARTGLLQGSPGPDQAPRLPVWNDPATGSLDQRARAWLDANCAHCHNPNGPAKSSGLDLRVEQAEPARWGVWKTPIAAGRGTGGRSYGIVPGMPEESILLYRMQSTEPGVMMPELSRRLVDEEGVALIRDWIAELKGRTQ
jgi:uncharacterized repeat protein (TIGR03806 family)